MTRAKVNDLERRTETYDTLHAGRNTTAGVNVVANLPNTRIWQVIIQADPDNTASVFVVNQNVQPFELVPGAALTVPIDRTNKVYVNITAGDAINWLAMG